MIVIPYRTETLFERPPLANWVTIAVTVVASCWFWAGVAAHGEDVPGVYAALILAGTLRTAVADWRISGRPAATTNPA